jgi:hypothetical protein
MTNFIVVHTQVDPKKPQECVKYLIDLSTGAKAKVVMNMN